MPLSKLSPQELILLQFVADGKTDDEVAEALGLRRGTIRSYWDRIGKKLSTRNRVHSVATYLRIERAREIAARDEAIALLRMTLANLEPFLSSRLVRFKRGLDLLTALNDVLPQEETRENDAFTISSTLMQIEGELNSGEAIEAVRRGRALCQGTSTRKLDPWMLVVHLATFTT